MCRPPCKLTLAKRADVNPVYITHCSRRQGYPRKSEIMRSEFGGMYDMERGSAEVRFGHDSEPMRCGEILSEDSIIHRCLT